jgi:hypothetical protein
MTKAISFYRDRSTAAVTIFDVSFGIFWESSAIMLGKWSPVNLGFSSDGRVLSFSVQIGPPKRPSRGRGFELFVELPK